MIVDHRFINKFWQRTVMLTFELKGKVPDGKKVLRNNSYAVVLSFGPSSCGGCNG